MLFFIFIAVIGLLIVFYKLLERVFQAKDRPFGIKLVAILWVLQGLYGIFLFCYSFVDIYVTLHEIRFPPPLLDVFHPLRLQIALCQESGLFHVIPKTNADVPLAYALARLIIPVLSAFMVFFGIEILLVKKRAWLPVLAYYLFQAMTVITLLTRFTYILGPLFKVLPKNDPSLVTEMLFHKGVFLITLAAPFIWLAYIFHSKSEFKN